MVKLTEMSISELRNLWKILLKLDNNLSKVKLHELIDEISDEVERRVNNGEHS